MNHLTTGQFHGQTNQILHLPGITLTDTEYTQPKVDWHYHENAYFTFILEGSVLEGNKKEVYNCEAGDLLFHNWQDPHYNIKPDGFTRGFQIELNNDWFDKFGFESSRIQGSMKIDHPTSKLLLYNIFKETKIKDESSPLAIESLLIQTLSQLFSNVDNQKSKMPEWAHKVRQILNDDLTKNHSLEDLVKELSIHPVHLSRHFSKYFHCSLGEYIRKLKLTKAISLMKNHQYSLTEVAYESGFSDQSHFCRTFKQNIGITPFYYRKLI
ncbi:MAG: AraC family transcriptional regulator [Saprospiraceae bacterium]|nr:AraC family transcriptional regulator [Saprospiraceae bacterium]MBK8635906.1 AraC family transcriptional regulator [Saprospiraceae bacterium]